jgi:hypothetical protein
LAAHTPDAAPDGGWSDHTNAEIRTNRWHGKGPSSATTRISAGAGNVDKQVDAVYNAFTVQAELCSRMATGLSPDRVCAYTGTTGIALNLATYSGGTPTIRGTTFNGAPSYPLAMTCISKGNDHTAKATGFADVNWTGAHLSAEIGCGLTGAGNDDWDNFSGVPAP